MNAAELTKALAGRWNGKSGSARCPAHDDRKASLTINDGRNGAPVVCCHAHCSQDTVISALRSAGLWPAERAPRTPWNPPSAAPATIVADNAPPPDFRAILGAEPSEMWDYLDADDHLLGYVCRIDKPDGKVVLPITWDGRAWVRKAFPEPRPLYNLPALADRPDAEVLVVEGEKVAVAASRVVEDHVAVTWPGGCAAVAKADWSPLKGRRVVVWPDADDPGAKAARDVVRACMAAGAAQVRVVALPEGLPKGWDLADDIPPGLDVARMIADAKDHNAERLAALPIKKASAIDSAKYSAIRWAVPGLVPDGCTILAGPKSRGKSFISLDLALAVASGDAALGNIACEQGDVLYLALEDGERRLRDRMRAILRDRPVPDALDIATEWRTIDAGGLEDIEAWIAGRPSARLIIIDVLAKVKGRPDRERGVYDQDYATIGPFHALARKHGIAIIIVHHTNKSTATGDPVLRISGTMGLSGAADTTLVLSREAREMHGTLDVRGRDVAEREIALQFDPETGCVIQLGAADDFRKSEQRRVIIRALIQNGDPMYPVDLAELLGRKRTSIRWLLAEMHKAGEIAKLPNGKYYAT